MPVRPGSLWLILSRSLLAGLMAAGLGGCQTVMAPAPANPAALAPREDPLRRRLADFGEILERVTAEYVEPRPVPLLLAAALRAVPGFLPSEVAEVGAAPDRRAMLLTFSKALARLSGGDRDRMLDLVGQAGAALVDGLDPYSTVFVASGRAGETGLTLYRAGPALVVGAVDPRGLTGQSGAMPGDVLEAVDGIPVAGASKLQAYDRLRGPVGRPVAVTIRRNGARLALSLERRYLPDRAVLWSRSEDAGIVRPGILTPVTLPSLSKALTEMQQRPGGGMTGLVVDLRDNGGGLLDVAVDVAGLLLPDGAVVGFLRGRSPAENRDYRARGGLLPAGMPVVVLVNRRTGAGAELLAAALRGAGATVVGERTFGEGTVQTVMPRLGLRLTTGFLFGPDGVPWQRRGIGPDLPSAAGGALVTDREEDLPGALQPPAPLPGGTGPGETGPGGAGRQALPLVRVDKAVAGGDDADMAFALAVLRSVVDARVR